MMPIFGMFYIAIKWSVFSLATYFIITCILNIKFFFLIFFRYLRNRILFVLNNKLYKHIVNKICGYYIPLGTFIKYYKISQLIHTQSIAN